MSVLTRSADLRPSSFDEDSLTFEAVISTGSDVSRRDARGAYVERLDLQPIDANDLAGLPLLNAHRLADGRDVIGRLVRAWHENGAIAAQFRLSAASDAAPIVQRVREGTLTGISIGYRPLGAATESSEGGKRVVRVVPAIFETSITPVPADAGAQIRSAPHVPDILINDDTAARIRSIGELADLPPSWADAQISANADEASARNAAREAMVLRDAPLSAIRATVSQPDVDTRRAAMEDALVVRMGGRVEGDTYREFSGASLRDLAEESLSLRGVSSRGMTPDAVFRAAHTTSDFPAITGGAGQRVLMASYQAAQSPLKMLARQGGRVDFRSGSTIRIGEMGELAKVTESGEITATTRGEAAESYALETFGRTFSLTRKAQINDDIGAFGDFARAAGQAAAQTEGSVLFSLLSQSSGAGPVMGEDSKRLFHADHGNLAGTGAAPSEATLSAARLALRTMKGLDGKTVIAATPKYLVVGPALETAAEKLLASITPATADNVNPFAGRLTLLVEPRITGNAWYVFADPDQLPVLEYSYLSSAPGPQMSQREGWEVLSTEYRVFLDFGAGAVDFRGAYRNAGA